MQSFIPNINKLNRTMYKKDDASGLSQVYCGNEIWISHLKNQLILSTLTS